MRVRPFSFMFISVLQLSSFTTSNQASSLDVQQRTETSTARTCRENQFLCDVILCLPQIWRCDGTEDCVDGSDEESCADSIVLPEVALPAPAVPHVILPSPEDHDYTYEEAVTRCQSHNAKPFIPKSEKDWDIVMNASLSLISEPPNKMWIPASDQKTEKILVWIDGTDGNADVLIPWMNRKVMHGNNHLRDCLISDANHFGHVTMEKCSHKAFPMICIQKESSTTVMTPVFTTAIMPVTTTPMIETTKPTSVFSTTVSTSTNSSITFSTININTDSKLSTSEAAISTTTELGIESSTSVTTPVLTTAIMPVTTTPMIETTNQTSVFSTTVLTSTNSSITFSTIDINTDSKLSTSVAATSTTTEQGIECERCSSKIPFSELYPEYTWPEEVPGSNSSYICPEGLGDKKATWTCQDDCTWYELPDLSQCGVVDSEVWKDELMNGNQSAGDTLQGLSTSLNTHNQIGPGDVISVLDILSVSWERHQKDLANLVAHEEQLGLSSNYTDSTLQVTDAILDKPQVWSGLPKNQKYSLSSQLQVALEQAAVETASLLQDNSKKNFSTKTTDVHIEKFPRTKNMLNGTVFEHPKFDNTYIKLPQQLDGNSLSANFLTFMAFSNLHQILGAPSLDEEDITFPIIAASPVIGLTLGNTSWHSHDDSINGYVQATFSQLYPLQDFDVSDLRCVSWNTEFNNWDPNGCWLIKGDSTNTTTCHCNHLTNLAVIMDVNGVLNSTSDAYVFMEYVTVIGCSMSIVCLAATIFCLMIFADIRSKMITKTRLNVCFCLMTAEIIMLTGLDKVEDVTGCIIIAALLHFFFLSTFMWAAIEGFYLYLKIIRVFPSVEPKLRTYILVGYTVPLLFVIITLASSLPDSYVGKYACWLGPIVIWAFAAPLGLIMIINIVIFILCMRAQWRTNSSDVQQNTKLLVKLRGSACIFFMLGITWITGFFYLHNQYLAIPFTILNSLQGVIIFLLLIPSDRIIRSRFKMLFSRWNVKEHQPLNTMTQGTRSTQSEMISRRQSSSTHVHNGYL